MYTGNTSSSFFVAFVALFAIVAMTGPASADTIPLMWDPNPETDIAGYIVHVGTEMGNHTQHIDVGPATSWQFPDAVPGQQYCFAVSAYFSGPVESPRSADVCGHSNATPTLGNPGSRTSTAGVETTLQLAGSDPQGEPLTYSATGLPPGLWVMTATGFIFGTPTTPGAYTVTAQASDGVLTASQTFTWTVVAQDSASPTVTITSPTSASTYAARAVTLTLTGTAADNVGVTQVTWVNNRGGSGTATGTTSWSTSVALQAGDNVVTVTARDATGNTAMDVLTVSYAAAPIQAGPLQMVGLTPDRAAPQAPGTAITWTAVSAGGQGPYQYKWWVFENGGWVVAQTWSTSNTYVWRPTRAASTYQVKAAVRSTSNGESADKYVTYSIAAYVDVTAPTVSIASPTTTTTWSTAGNTLTLSGTASDNAGVTQVSWVNNRGGSGTATGTTNWTASVALQAGDNLVTVTARDAIGNTAVDTLTVSYSEGPIQVLSLTPDRAAPQARGTAITWTAVAAGGQGPYQYKFWVLEATGWVTKQTWSASNTYVWQPTSASSAYQVKVAVRSTTNGESDDNYATYVIR